MSHMSGRTLSNTRKILNVSSRQSGATDKSCCSVKKFTGDYKFSKHDRADGQHKMKRLKTWKERSRMRASGKEASKTKSPNHHHSCHQSSKDMARAHHCCHSSNQCHSLFPSVPLPSHEPSIITDSRLIGHHGLFNHEVKSIDIERLLSEQKKLEESGQKAQKKNHAISNPFSSTPLCSKYSVCADTDEVVPFEKKEIPHTSIHDGSGGKGKQIDHGSDITPGQRPQQQRDLSSQCYKTFSSSKHSSPSVVTIKSKRPNSVMQDKAPQLTPTADKNTVKTLRKKVKTHVISSCEPTPKNQEPPEFQTQAHSLSPSPPLLSSSLTADNFDIQHKRQGPGCVTMSVSAIAESLCDCLRFPLARRRNLVAESREVLLKALQERHGPWLQENLLKEQRRLRFGTDLTKAAKDRDQEPTMMDECEPLPTDASLFKASQPCFDTQKTTSFKVMGSSLFNWKSSLQPHQSLEQIAEWSTSPVDTSASLLDDIFRPRCSPQFRMDFEPSGASASDHLFTPFPFSYSGETASASQHWNDSFNRPATKESFIFESSENSFMNQPTGVRERSCDPHYNDDNAQPFLPHQTWLPDKRSADQMHSSQDQNQFETERNYLASSLFTEIRHPNQSIHFQPFRQFTHPSTCPPFRAHHNDMMHYPPSHVIERHPALPLSSLPSPEHWSFPPMKLY